MFGGMFKTYGIKMLDPSTIDWKMVDYYLSNRKIIDTLDHWILIPDYDNLPTLLKVRDLINNAQPLKTYNNEIYRGFSFKAAMQNSMGIVHDARLTNQNHRFDIKLDVPISFTTDLEIAESFGSTVLGIVPGTDVTKFLRITNEMAAAICKLRNIDLQTQHEWIFLPDTPITAKARMLKYKKPKAWELF